MTINLNGQTLYFLDKENLTLLERGILCDESISSNALKMIQKLHQYSIHYNELYLTYAKLESLKKIIPYILLKNNSKYIRMLLTHHNCNNCNWSCIIGDPFAMDNFIGVSHEEKSKIFKDLESYPKANCNRCGKVISNSIWTGDILT